MHISLTAGGMGIESDLILETGNKITFRATDLRKQATGVHGKVLIGFDGRVLAHTVFNMDRDEDRGRLINKSFNMLPSTIREVYDKGILMHEFDIFCLEGYKVWIGNQTPAFMVPLSERTPPNFLINPFIIQGGGTILFGPPGKGKSYVAMAIAVAVDTGNNTIFDTNQGRVLFVNLERSEESLQRRLLNINLAMGVEEDHPLLTLNARGKTYDDVREAIEDAVRDYDVRLIVLDSISRAGMGDLNDNRPVNKIIDALNNSCDTWLGLAHAPRNDSTHVYGSVHFDAGADIVVQQVSEAKERSLGVGLNVIKANDIGKTSMTMLGFEFDEIGLTRVFKPSKADFPEIMAARQMNTQEEIYTFLEDTDKASAAEIAAAVNKSRSMVSNYLNNDSRYEKFSDGRTVYFAIK